MLPLPPNRADSRKVFEGPTSRGIGSKLGTDKGYASDVIKHFVTSNAPSMGTNRVPAGSMPNLGTGMNPSASVYSGTSMGSSGSRGAMVQGFGGSVIDRTY